MHQGSRRGHIVPPPPISLGWLGLGFQLLLEMACLGVIYHIQKDPWSLDAQNPPKKYLNLKFLFVTEAFDPVREGPPIWNFGISDELWNEIISRSKKCTALFQTHNWEKLSFFKARTRICIAQIYANTWQGGAQCAIVPPSFPRGPPLGQLGII